MKKRFSISFLVILLLAFGVYWVYQNITRIQITTWPVSAKVFLDGTYVGDTPYALQTFGKRSYLLELKTVDFYPVSYQFDSQNTIAPEKLAIHLLPKFYRKCNINQDFSADLCETDGIVNAQDYKNLQEFLHYSDKNKVYYSVVSPDGNRFAYATEGEQYNKFWLGTVSNLDDVTALFEDFTSDKNLIRAFPLEFSPNSEWVSLDSNGTLIMSPVDDPKKVILKLEDVLYSRWSSDGQWLAVSFHDKRQTVIYHFVNNQWTIHSDISLVDDHVAFSLDNRYLFTKAWGDKIETPFLKIIDVNQMKLVRTYLLEGDSAGIFNPKESLDGGAFAVAPDLYDSKTRIQKGVLLFGRFDNDIHVQLDDENYEEVLYWLEGDVQIATLVSRENNNGPVDEWMKIVDVPAELLK